MIDDNALRFIGTVTEGITFIRTDSDYTEDVAESQSMFVKVTIIL